jgi:hypothetical protein
MISIGRNYDERGFDLLLDIRLNTIHLYFAKISYSATIRENLMCLYA